MAEPIRWLNQSQPQTLYMGTILLYVDAVLGFIFGSPFAVLHVVLGLLALGGMAAAGYGIANEKRWGYQLGVALAALQVGLLAWVVARGDGSLLDLDVLIAAVFPVVLLLLLVHPQSREYQRIWFR